MKKTIFPLMMILTVMNVSALLENSEFVSNYTFVLINVIQMVLVLLLSFYLYKFINITRKHPIFVFAYIVVALLMFSSILNIFYFMSIAEVDYLLIYFIDRTTILMVLLIVFFGFRKFRKTIS